MIKPISFLLLTLAAGIFGRDEYTRTFQKTVPLASGGRLEIDNRFGDVLVRTQPKPEVSINAAIKVSASDQNEAKRYAETVVIDVQQTGALLSVRTRYPEMERRLFSGRDVSYSVTYDIVMPETAPLTVRNTFGGVVVGGLKANAEISNAHGRLIFKDARGTHRFDNQFGPVEVERNTGDIAVTNANGPVRVADINGSANLRGRFGEVFVRRTTGALTIGNANGPIDLAEIGGVTNITNSFGPVSANAVKADLTVRNANGPIEANNIGGSADLSTSFAAVKFSDVSKRLAVHSRNAQVSGNKVGEDAVIETSFGSVDVTGARKGVHVVSGNAGVSLRDIGGEVYVKTSFGQVRAERVAGAVTVEDNNGAVRISGAGGGVKVGSSFAAVQIDGAGGAVEVQNQNGLVSVSGLPKSCVPVVLKTSFAPLRVALPDGIGYNVAAKTSFGQIRSEFGVTASGAIGGDALNGRIGNGGCDLRLNNANGSIEIVKDLKR